MKRKYLYVSALRITLLVCIAFLFSCWKKPDATSVFYKVMDGNLPKESIVSLHVSADSTISGYRVIARLTITDSNSISKVLSQWKKGRVFISKMPGRTWKLEVDTASAYADEELIAASASWWDFSPTEPADVYFTTGRNCLTHEYWHWWIVPTDPHKKNVIYFVGGGF